MRLRLTLQHMGPSPAILPVNYQYPVSAWIYSTLSQGDHAFARFLHQTGFSNATKTYKLFTFSFLSFPHEGMRVEGDRLLMLSQEATLEVSFAAPEVISPFMAGIFTHRQFHLGDSISRAPFRITGADAIPIPQFDTRAAFKTLSPIVVGKNRTGRPAQYLGPGDEDFDTIFFDNLTRKYAAAIQTGLLPVSAMAGQSHVGMTLTPIDTPRRKLIKIKAGKPGETHLAAWSFRFRITAPLPLLRLGYLAGFGSNNSLGFGCCAPLIY